MDYQKHYLNLIFRAENRILPEEVYTEKHHVLPNCIQENDWIIKLTGPEHYVAHQLLYKIYKGTKYEYKLLCAIKAMGSGLYETCNNNKLYNWYRKKFNQHMKEVWIERRKKLIPKINIQNINFINEINIQFIQQYQIIEVNGIIKKKCKTCNEYVDVKEYYKDLTMKLGISNSCQKCWYALYPYFKEPIQKINILEYISLQNIDPKLTEKYDLIEENGIIKKKCKDCGEYVDIKKYHKDPGMKIGISNRCKKCDLY